MRALGPGSVSSFLKVILDVFFYILCTAAVVVAVLILAVLLISFDPGLIPGHFNIGETRLIGDITIGSPWAGPLAAAVLAGAELDLIGVIIIVGRLRRIFATMTAGDPFHPDNVSRLRIIAAMLALLEVGSYVARALSRMIPGAHIHAGSGFNLTAWFAVLVILVLSEVFREGARLRRDAELTI